MCIPVALILPTFISDIVDEKTIIVPSTTFKLINKCIFKFISGLSHFQELSKGHAALYIVSYHSFTLEIRKCTFEYNNRAINVDHVVSENVQIFISGSSFVGNIAGGPGGALFIDHTMGDISTVIEDCRYDKYKRIQICRYISIVNIIT